MKKLFFLSVLVFLFAFIIPRQPTSTISGIVTPADAVVKIWAISNTDSLSTIPVAGKFSVTVKEGIWNLVVEGVKPYQNATVTGITVIDGQPNDVGTIVLRK